MLGLAFVMDVAVTDDVLPLVDLAFGAAGWEAATVFLIISPAFRTAGGCAGSAADDTSLAATFLVGAAPGVACPLANALHLAMPSASAADVGDVAITSDLVLLAVGSALGTAAPLGEISDVAC